MFTAEVDTKELALVERVAAKVNPGAFWKGDIVAPPDQQAIERSIRDANQERARDIAQEIIQIVRAADSQKTQAGQH